MTSNSPDEDDTVSNRNESSSSSYQTEAAENSSPSASSWLPSSWTAAFTELADDQRIERLAQCRILEQTLSDCRHFHLQQQKLLHTLSENKPSSSWWWWWWGRNQTSPKGATTTTTTDNHGSSSASQQQQHQQPYRQLEEFTAGIRMLRYFDWRNYFDENDDKIRHVARPCLREEHALWACRAVSLQCGPDLVQLRECFRTAGPERILSRATGTAYETTTTTTHHGETTQQIQNDLATTVHTGDSSTNNSDCRALQTQLGSCVQRNAVALEKRRQQRLSNKER